jgi:rod shape-determining protein MreC
MESFFSRYKNVLVLVVVLLAQVVGLAVQVRHPSTGAPEAAQVRLIRYWVVSLVAPPERWLHSIGSGVRGMWSNYVGLRGIRQQNRDLKAEVDRLRMEQAGLMEDARQGQRLQQLLSFKEHYIYKTVPAQIIGTSGSDLSHVLYIDKGSRDGVKPDMPAITPDGIVGKIKDVFPHTSQLLLISDQTSGAGVLLETLRIRGILRGNSLGRPQIVNVMPDDRIQAGERVLTSGGDEVYPRGLPVGVVERTVPDPDHDGYVAIVVKPAANLSRLEEVLVVTDVADHVPAAEQHDIAQSVSEADAKKRAADILSDRLPGLKDPNAPAPAPNAVAAPADGYPGRPAKAGVALHPDRFSPDTAPPASTMTPGQTAHPSAPSTGYADSPASRPQAVPGSKMGPQRATPSQAAKPLAGSGAPTATPGATVPRKPKVVSPDGTVSQPAAPRTSQPRPTQFDPATSQPPATKPAPKTPSPDANPPGGRL